MVQFPSVTPAWVRLLPRPWIRERIEVRDGNHRLLTFLLSSDEEERKCSFKKSFKLSHYQAAL
jgi:hypothetical protein